MRPAMRRFFGQGNLRISPLPFDRGEDHIKIAVIDKKQDFPLVRLDKVLKKLAGFP